MILDYTLCDGLIDPPMDWFKNGKKQLIETEKKTHCSWRPFLVGNLLGYSGKTADDIQDFLYFSVPIRRARVKSHSLQASNVFVHGQKRSTFASKIDLGQSGQPQ